MNQDENILPKESQLFSGTRVVSIMGPTGPTGSAGPTGPEGFRGPTGPTAAYYNFFLELYG